MIYRLLNLIWATHLHAVKILREVISRGKVSDDDREV